MRVAPGALMILLAASTAEGREPPKGEDESAVDLVIEVLGLRSDEGNVNIAVYDSASWSKPVSCRPSWPWFGGSIFR